MSVHSAIVFLGLIGIHLHNFPRHCKRYSLDVKEDQQKSVIHFAHQVRSKLESHKNAIQALRSHNASMLNSTYIVSRTRQKSNIPPDILIQYFSQIFLFGRLPFRYGMFLMIRSYKFFAISGSHVLSNVRLRAGKGLPTIGCQSN